LEKKVLDAVKAIGATHPRALEAQLGRRRVVNAWGSHSKATTQALDWLHYRGLVRIVRRENGIRVYESIPPHPERLSPRDRLAGIVKTVANILAPVLEGTLARETARYRELGSPRAVLQELIDKGELERHSAGTTRYVYPRDVEAVCDPPRQVRFLAPFDPIVWDRRRFELLWGWPYRFEAYTPPARRVRGYYAMPLLWGDAIVGWANASIVKGKLDVSAGFIRQRPRDRAFSRELDAEIARLDEFLQPR